MSQKPATPDEDIVHDQRSLEVREKVLERLKENSKLNSISKVAMFVGTMLTTAGVGMLLSAIAGTAAAIASPIIIGGVLAAGVAMLGVAVTTDYAASRIWQRANFDNLEANASSTARHLVKQLQKNNMCLTESKDAPCDKNWAAQIEAERVRAQQQAQSASIH